MGEYKQEKREDTGKREKANRNEETLQKGNYKFMKK